MEVYSTVESYSFKEEMKTQVYIFVFAIQSRYSLKCFMHIVHVVNPDQVLFAPGVF